MFKISKTGWVILVAGILVIALGSLGMAYVRQNNEEQQLEMATAEAKAKLDGFVLDEFYAERDALSDELSKSLSERDAARAVLSPMIESIDITGQLFRIADDCGVKIISVSSSPLSENQVNKLIFHVLPVNIAVEGKITSIIDYLNKLDSDFTAGFVESVETHVAEAGSGQETSASIQMRMYTYGG